MAFVHARAAERAPPAQLRTLMSVDDMVGTVMDEVDRLGESNTLAVYMSDNGLLWGEHHIGDSKRFPYTASVGVPMLLRWPGHIDGGSADARLAANIDLAPTIQDAVDGTRERTVPARWTLLIIEGQASAVVTGVLAESGLARGAPLVCHLSEAVVVRRVARR